MPRPIQCRRVCLSPTCTYFKPAGIPMTSLEEIVLAVDELEAMRLADVEGIYHEQAANQMGISRRTFGRIIESARKKVAQALIQGMDPCMLSKSDPLLGNKKMLLSSSK